ncbi:CPBP family intramembrane glutamic endopeptidase [Cohnella sp. REN36]|uniref:CPBP family intramembrane glutamic endopeptidase n=1 Tax=Cohnella sp. REN36 TaxID=2887347 RepID=UPI001D14F8B0|nr:CPBP family intramembrane glutamic endopeptidase [Cohnella sp. REN36]MCC3373883.1 CPBP family intramembrane metalloprotease [Cohnella sp. REN36]
MSSNIPLQPTRPAEPPRKRQSHLRLALLFAACGLVAAAAVLPYQLAVTQATPAAADVPLAVSVIASLAQAAVLTFLASWLGLAMAGRVGLGAPLLRSRVYRGESGRSRPRWSWGGFAVGAVGSLIGTIVLLVLDIWLFQPRMPEVEQAESVALWKGALTFLYGGVVEEVLLRLFTMTLIVWLIAKLMRREAGRIPAAVYVAGIVLAALLFGVGHLPATQAAFGELTPWLVARGLIANGMLGLWFGYLYWRRGLEYAIAAHMVADLLLHLIAPALLS